MVVEDIEDAAVLPRRNDGTLAHIPEHVVVSQVGNSGHILRQLLSQLVQLGNDKATLASLQTDNELVELLKERFFVGALTGNTAATILTCLIGEYYTSQYAVEQLVLIELASRERRGREGDVGTERRIARHAVCCGTESSGALLVIDIADGLAYLPVTATQAVGHLNLRHIVVLRVIAASLTCHRVLEESRIGDVRGREEKGHIRTSWFFLIGALGLDGLLPDDELLQFVLVVLTELAHDCFNTGRQLALTHARIGYQMCHLTTNLLPSEVCILKFRTTNIGSQSREKHRNDGLTHVWSNLRGQKFDAFNPFSEVWHRWCCWFCNVVSH